MRYINNNNEAEVRKYIGLAGLTIKYETIRPPNSTWKLWVGAVEEVNNIDNNVVIKK